MIAGWVQGDPAGHRWILEYADPQSWTALFSSTRWGFVALDGQTPIGFADVELDQATRTAYFTYYVAPNWRGQGYSRPLLDAISGYLREQTDADKLQGSVEPQNVASSRALVAAGFNPIATDIDGLTSYVLKLDR
ncbi:GNAT family N-acetyltransferase [Kribbella antibiotica]|uniref:GNAT family N-acetyltransferase n=1 Tax=Kribbella antibiotica TaxID=190195 RepID=UPI001405525E|nr:GNAT family protein [Kribbella antibiotica]